MSIRIHSSFLPQTDPEAAIAFYRDALGWEVRNDVGYEGLRWITIGPADQPYGVRDAAFRDPSGNLLRLQQR